MSAKGAREVLYLGAPFRDNLDKGVVVDEADIEALATVFDNIPDGEVLIRLVQVVARSCAKTLPRPGVLVKLNMDPHDGFVVLREAAVVQEILLDKFAVVILFFDVDCFLIFVINETNHHNKEIGNRQFDDFVFEHME